MKILKYLSPEPEGAVASATTEVIEETPTPFGDVFSAKEEEEVILEEEQEKPLVAEAPVVETPEIIAEREKAELAEKETAKIAEVTKDFTPEQKAQFEKGEIDEKGVAIPVQEGFKTGTEAAVELESNWTNLAKELNYGELKEDSFEAFTAAAKARDDAKEQEFRTAPIEKLVEHLPVESQIYVRAINAGLTPEQIAKPLVELNNAETEIKGFLAMDSESLYTAAKKELGWDDEVIEHHLTKLVAEDKLELEVAPIKNGLNGQLGEIAKEREGLNAAQLADIKELENQLIQKKQTALKEDFETFKKTMDTIPEFMGTKLSSENKQLIINKYQKGEYTNLLKDHKDFIEFAMWKEFGKEAQNALLNKALENKQKEILGDLHAIPPIKKVAGSVSKVAVDKKSADTPFANVLG